MVYKQIIVYFANAVYLVYAVIIFNRKTRFERIAEFAFKISLGESS